MSDAVAVIRFAIKKYYGNDLKQAAEVTGYSQSQIKRWLDGSVNPREATANYFLELALTPEFQVVCEFRELDHNEALSPQISSFLEGHKSRPGVYAFYDSLCRLLYVGKANASLHKEIISALGRPITTPFPIPAKKLKPATRKTVVKYISAYDVGGIGHSDYPKHVESLILRISKPLLNQQTGALTKVIHARPEE